MPKNTQVDPVVLEISIWFREHAEDKHCLLPQSLPDKLLEKLINGQISKEEPSKKADNMQAHGLLTAVGLMLADEQKKFGASRDELALAVKAYSFNLMLESLIRTKVIAIKSPFSADNIFDLSFEREISLTDAGRQAAQKAGSPLANLLAGFGPRT